MQMMKKLKMMRVIRRSNLFHRDQAEAERSATSEETPGVVQIILRGLTTTTTSRQNPSHTSVVDTVRIEAAWTAAEMVDVPD